MATFLVERYMPRAAQPGLAALVAKARQAALDLAEQGVDITHLGSTLNADDETCFCTYEAASADAVRRANEQAGLDFDRISDVYVVP